MKQVLVKEGSVYVADVPAPTAGPRNILVRVAHSCISSGTELNSVEMSGLPLYKRALRQPENVRRVMRMIREQGFGYTFDRVRGQLASGGAIGYSAAGTVIAVGSEVDGFSVGDRVACAGAGIANHAEFIDVPVNLAVRVPGDLDLKSAATVTLGAIALQGVRRANPTLGETFVVVGLGLLGQLTVQMLRANGCRVIGLDPAEARRATAQDIGATVFDPTDIAHLEQILRATEGDGADGAIITAAGASHDIVNNAFRSCRRKGRVVLVGDVGLNLRRSDFYAKEVDFLISTSYGPGRYDPLYEEGGQDYPFGYVRWTENRNMAAYLAMLAGGQIRLAPLAPVHFPLAAAAEAYSSLKAAENRALVALIDYPNDADPTNRVTMLERRRALPRQERIRVAVVGAGSFAQGMHLPNLQRLRDRYEIRAVVSRTGQKAKAVAQQYGANYATTDFDAALSDGDIDLVLIATRHHLHAAMVQRALQAGKHVLVEKPLALREDELRRIEAFYRSHTIGAPLLMTGFNRRFAPATAVMKGLLEKRDSPLLINYRMNAGYIPPDHWVHGPEGGGRNIGEACHIYDLFHWLTGSSWTDVYATSITPVSRYWRGDDNFSATAKFADGSVCSLTYTALGSKTYAKEQMEVFCDGMILALDDFRRLQISGRRHRGWSAAGVQKGQFEELGALAECLGRDGSWPISLSDQLAATRLSFAVQEKLERSASA